MAGVMEASLELAKELQAAAELSPELDLPASKAAKLDIEPGEKLTKTIQLDPEDPTKVTHIGAQLDPKYEFALIKSSKKIGTSLRGSHLTCLVFLGS